MFAEEVISGLASSARALYQDEDIRTKSASARPAAREAPRRTVTQEEDLKILRKRFPFLKGFSESFLVNTPIEVLLKMGTTEMKMNELDRNKNSSNRLSDNKTALASTFTEVEAGNDNRWNVLHPSRYLAGAGVSATKMWLNARKVVGLKGFPAIGNYDMSSIGLAGLVTAKGWTELHDPSSIDLRLKLFNVNSVSSKGKPEDDDITELADFRLAVRALKAAMQYVMPWNRSIDAIDGFLQQTNYCATDTANLERRSQILTQFVDYVLGQNAEHWRDEEPFLTCGDLKTAWVSFFGVRSQSVGKKRDRDHHHKKQHPARRAPTGKNDGICWAYNDGRCLKAAGDCKASSGRELKHICNFLADKSKPEEVCGKEHMRVKFH